MLSLPLILLVLSPLLLLLLPSRSVIIIFLYFLHKVACIGAEQYTGARRGRVDRLPLCLLRSRRWPFVSGSLSQMTALTLNYAYIEIILSSLSLLTYGGLNCEGTSWTERRSGRSTTAPPLPPIFCRYYLSVSLYLLTYQEYVSLSLCLSPLSLRG